MVYMRIYIGCCLVTAVSEPFLYLLYVESQIQKHTSAAVSEAMERDILKSELCHYSGKFIGHIVGIYKLSLLVHADEIGIVCAIFRAEEITVIGNTFFKLVQMVDYILTHRKLPIACIGLQIIRHLSGHLPVRVFGSDTLMLNLNISGVEVNMPICHLLLNRQYENEDDYVKLVKELVNDYIIENPNMSSRHIPSKFKIRSSMPFTKNSKIDFNALKNEALSGEEINVDVDETILSVGNITVYKKAKIQRRINHVKRKLNRLSVDRQAVAEVL